MKKQERLEQGFRNALGGFNELQNKFLVGALENYSNLIKESISTKAGDITTQKLDIQQGFAAEAHHVGSYNIEAAAKGQNNHQATLSTANDPIKDISVNSPAGRKDYQIKFYKDGEASAKAFNHPDYSGVGKIVPADQLGDARATAQREAARNQKSRPEVSRNYEDTTQALDDSICSDDRPDIRSKPLNRRGEGSAEDLVEQTKRDGKGPEYADKQRVRSEFNSMQYANAAKAGALAGASMTAVSELVGIMRSDAPLTREQCMLAAERVVMGSLKGAGNAILLTGIQHVGQGLVDAATNTAIRSAGRQLVKGNVAAAAANIIVDLGENIYRFSCGEIDSLEFAGSTISNTVSVVGGALAYSAGTATATFLGQWVASEIAATTLFGTTLGALGPIALGAVFSIGFSFALAAYVGYFSREGAQLAMADMQQAMAKLNNGSVNLSQYVGIVGTMSDFRFEWKDMLPFSGSIAVFSEYQNRKGQLMAVQKDLAARIAGLAEQEREILYQLYASYVQQTQAIEVDYQRMRSQVTLQATERYGTLGKELDEHLKRQFLIFAPIWKHFENKCAALGETDRRQQLRQARIDFYRSELERLKLSLENAEFDQEEGPRIRRAVLATIETRLSEILPKKTSWDEAYEFLVVR